MTDTPGWAPPSSSEPAREDVRPPADAPATVPGQSGPHHGTQPGWGTGHGGPYPGGQYPGGQYPGWGVPLSPKPGIIPLRPLGVGEILDGAVSTVRKHWRPALGLSLGLAAGGQAVIALAQWWAFSHLDSLVSVVAVLVGYPVTLLLNIIATAMLTMVVSKAILGESITLRTAWADARPRLARLFGLTLLNGLIIGGIVLIAAAPFVIALITEADEAMIGLMMIAGLVVGVPLAVWVGIQLSLSAPALMLEKQGVMTALARSRRLVRGSWWRIFGITLLTNVVVRIVAGIVAMPFSVVALVVSGDSFIDDSAFGASALELPPIALLLNAIGGTVAGTITIPVSAAISVLLYVDQRIRREALDIELARAAGLPEYGGTGWAGGPAPSPGV
ncbi:hypothetical protein [Kitasatospora sp. NPDC050543]|uniref:DUF7544 domain-containing protein n=1 Tax=Kitasatospora sp. NPDC050543 TaxID=3364054 RepID=UPI0037BD0779